MFGSDVLDVAIGMVLLFLLMSLSCTALREAIEMWTQTRAANLEKALVELLREEDTLRNLYNHPLVDSLFKGRYPAVGDEPKFCANAAGKVMAVAKSNRKGYKLPSYIPSQNFARAMLDIVVRGPPTQAAADTSQVVTMDSLRASVAKVQNPTVQRALMTAIDNADGELEKVQKNVEDWFNGSMDRVSGRYKRRTQWILFGIGLGAAIVLNVDAITVANSLNADKSLRKIVVDQASTFVHAQDGARPSGGPPGTTEQKPPETSLSDVQGLLNAIALPIGWRWTGTSVIDLRPAPQSCQGSAAPTCAAPAMSVGAWISAALGWLITALAVMLGAPFWFDLLNKLMLLRSTVKPQEATDDKSAPAAAAP